MKRCLLVPSNNGYGHLRRLLSVANALKQCGIEPHLNIAVGDTQKRNIASDYEVTLVDYAFPSYLDGPFSKQQDVRGKTRLDPHIYDAVVTDNLIELGQVHPNSILIAQFTWREYFERKQSKSSPKIVSDYSVIDFLSKFRRLFGMKHFAWGVMKVQTNYVSVPLLDYWGLSQKRNLRTLPEILLMKSGINSPIIENLYKDFNKKVRIIREVQQLDFIPKGVICRPGLSTLLEILSLGVRPILVREPFDPEMIFNEGVVLNQKWGIALKCDLPRIELSTDLALARELDQTVEVPVEELITSVDFVNQYLYPII